jgi:hypothetical protein
MNAIAKVIPDPPSDPLSEPVVLPESYSRAIPPPVDSRRGGVNDTLRRMEVGDSVLMHRLVANSLYSRAHKVGIKVRTRIEADNPNYVRVWRLA